FTIAVSPQANATYNLISVRDGNSCSLSTRGSATVNVFDTNVPLNPTNTGPICGSGSVTFSVTQYPAFDYYWTGPSGFVSTAPSFTISVTSLQAGIYRVYAYIGNCTTRVDSTRLVVTQNTPQLTIDNIPNNACVGNPVDIGISLTGSGPWILSYVLNNGNIQNAQINSSPYVLQITPPTPGLYKVSFLRLIEGRCTTNFTNQSVDFVVNSGFTLSLSSEIITGCRGRNCWRIKAQAQGNISPVTYRLVETNTTNSTGQFDNLAPGNYTIEAQDINCKVTRTITLRDPNDGSGYDLGLYQKPTIINAITDLSFIEVEWQGNCPEYTLQYRIRGTGNWATVSNIRQNRYRISGLAPYTSYEIRVGESCLSPSVVYGDAITLGTFRKVFQEWIANKFSFVPRVYPNPTSGILIIDLGKVEPGFVKIEIYNSEGKLVQVLSQKVTNEYELEALTVTIDITDLPLGVYHLELQNNSHKARLKVLHTH
ncbi:MAG: T9SS type A sorting domain-containing protein, partial [Bacteroidia bacterium]|nr:T9SS type A sorting domain-containing protein [Bacteroidia bacterium]MDW8158119.1 T9SS type A sorting domain-containing protein [Bacteroidia bacterium]